MIDFHFNIVVFRLVHAQTMFLIQFSFLQIMLLETRSNTTVQTVLLFVDLLPVGLVYRMIKVTIKYSVFGILSLGERSRTLLFSKANYISCDRRPVTLRQQNTACAWGDVGDLSQKVRNGSTKYQRYGWQAAERWKRGWYWPWSHGGCRGRRICDVPVVLYRYDIPVHSISPKSSLLMQFEVLFACFV